MHHRLPGDRRNQIIFNYPRKTEIQESAIDDSFGLTNIDCFEYALESKEFPPSGESINMNQKAF